VPFLSDFSSSHHLPHPFSTLPLSGSLSPFSKKLSERYGSARLFFLVFPSAFPSLPECPVRFSELFFLSYCHPSPCPYYRLVPAVMSNDPVCLLLLESPFPRLGVDDPISFFHFFDIFSPFFSEQSVYTVENFLILC